MTRKYVLPRAVARVIFVVLLLLGTDAMAFAAENPAPAWMPSPPADPKTFSLVIDVVTEFGAKGDGKSDDWEAIQRALGMNAAGICTYSKPTLVVLPPTTVSDYVISQAIRPCSGVTIWIPSPKTTIIFKGNAVGPDYTGAVNLGQWVTQAALTGGSIDSDAYVNLPFYAIAGGVSIGQTEVRLQNSRQSENLRAGDIVAVETATTYFVGQAIHPTRLRAAIVAALSEEGVVTLDRAVDFISPNVKLRQLSNLALLPGWPNLAGNAGRTNIPVGAVKNFALIGGKWIAGGQNPALQPFMSIGGCIDCTIAPHEVVAGYGVGYGNFWQNCRFSVEQEIVSATPLEVAFGSAYSQFNIESLDVRDVLLDRPDIDWLVGLDEGAHDNKIHVGRMTVASRGLAAELDLAGEVAQNGQDLVSVTVVSPNIDRGAPVSVTYTTKPGDALSAVAAAIAAAINENGILTAAGFEASVSPGRGRNAVVVANAKPGVGFYVVGRGTDTLIAYAPPRDIVRIFDAYNNRVLIDALSSNAITGNVVNVSDMRYAGVPPPTRQNEVSVSQSRVEHQLGHVSMSGATTTENTVRDGEYYGEIYQPAAFWLHQGTGGGNAMRNLSSDAADAYIRNESVETLNAFKNVCTVKPEIAGAASAIVALPGGVCAAP